MSDSNWMFLNARQINALHNQGIDSYAELVSAIEVYGLYELPRGDYMFWGDDAPGNRNIGIKGWEAIIRMLESRGFDWRAYIIHPFSSKPSTSIDWHMRIERKVDELVGLLKEYRNQ